MAIPSQSWLPLAIVALAAFVFGVISAAGNPERDMAKRFVDDWAHQDFKAMHDELSASAQEQYSVSELAAATARMAAKRIFSSPTMPTGMGASSRSSISSTPRSPRSSRVLTSRRHGPTRGPIRW